MSHTKIVLLAFFVLFTACSRPCSELDPKQQLILRLDDYMIPLGKAVDVVADKLPPEAEDQEIFAAVLERSGNPLLLKPFEEYMLKARIINGIGIVLLCSKDGKEGIIEDVSCTTRPDSLRPSGSPCAYMLDPNLVCLAH